MIMFSFFIYICLICNFKILRNISLSGKGGVIFFFFSFFLFSFFLLSFFPCLFYVYSQGTHQWDSFLPELSIIGLLFPLLYIHLYIYLSLYIYLFIYVMHENTWQVRFECDVMREKHKTNI